MESISEPIEKLSFGMSLDQLFIYTTDKDWVKNFIKTKKASEIFKRLQMKNAFVYWNP